MRGAQCVQGRCFYSLDTQICGVLDSVVVVIVKAVRKWNFFFQITRPYAEFSAAIVSMNESFPDEKVRTLCHGRLDFQVLVFSRPLSKIL